MIRGYPYFRKPPFKHCHLRYLRFGDEAIVFPFDQCRQAIQEVIRESVAAGQVTWHIPKDLWVAKKWQFC